jgi:cytochrome d ubiquinol oxidase subunit II
VSLAEVPIVLILAGLAAYVVLAGADFGAGFWQLAGGSGRRATAIREFAHHAMGPVWEANHVWLIFVLVVCWTAYPRAFGSITSTLALPLFIAGIGIVLRGTAYALRSGTETPREQRIVEVGMAVSSILTPFALGAAIGGIASGRVPVGNAAGDLFSSWLNPTSVAIGVIAVAACAYLAAVYLAADAARRGRRELEEAFRLRALAMAAVAGAAAVVGLIVVHDDAHLISHGLTHGAGLAAVIVSGVAGVATGALVLVRRYGWARATAAAAVTAIIAGWGLAQRPHFLPGLTIKQAAAGRSSLVATVVALAVGALILLPSLALLFRLVLGGRFDEEAERAEAEPEPAAPVGTLRNTRMLGAAIGLFAVAAGLMILVEEPWARIAGVTFLLGSVGIGFVSLGSLAVASEREPDREGR